MNALCVPKFESRRKTDMTTQFVTMSTSDLKTDLSIFKLEPRRNTDLTTQFVTKSAYIIRSDCVLYVQVETKEKNGPGHAIFVTKSASQRKTELTVF